MTLRAYWYKMNDQMDQWILRSVINYYDFKSFPLKCIWKSSNIHNFTSLFSPWDLQFHRKTSLPPRARRHQPGKKEENLTPSRVYLNFMITWIYKYLMAYINYYDFTSFYKVSFENISAYTILRHMDFWPLILIWL